MTSRRDANDGRGALAHALEGIEQGCGSFRRQARNVDSDSPHVRSPRIDRAMRLTGWDDQDVTGFEHPHPTLIDAGNAVDVERDRREAVADRRTAGAVADRQLDTPSEDRCTVFSIIHAYAWGRVMHTPRSYNASGAEGLASNGFGLLQYGWWKSCGELEAGADAPRNSVLPPCRLPTRRSPSPVCESGNGDGRSVGGIDVERERTRRRCE